MPSLASIDDLPIFLFPLDKDVLTLELDLAFKEFHVEMDPTGMHHIARALVLLQKRYGAPSKVFGKGTAASYVFNLMQNIKQESGSFKPQVRNSHLVIYRTTTFNYYCFQRTIY